MLTRVMAATHASVAIRQAWQSVLVGSTNATSIYLSHHPAWLFSLGATRYVTKPVVAAMAMCIKYISCVLCCAVL